MSSSRSPQNSPPKNPAVVTLVSQLVGHQRALPRHGGYVTAGELQSLHARLQRMMVQVATMAEIVESIRGRLEKEAKDDGDAFLKSVVSLY